MLRSRTYKYILLLIAAAPFVLHAQEPDYDSLFQRIDTVENTVYKPVVSFNYGIFNFMGEVNDSYNSAVIGKSAFQVNVATFIDKKNYYTANFYYLTGTLSASSYSHSDMARNLNFQSEVSVFGANLEYRFGHLFGKEALVRPYLSFGVGNLSFNTKGDLYDARGRDYYYWSDGSVRDVAETSVGPNNLLYRDYDYETDLRLYEEREYGLGDYNQRSMVIPVSLGAYFRISRRAFFGMGATYNYAVTDLLDNVAFEGTHIQGDKANDAFLYSHISLHFDLFSDPATRTVDLMFADTEFDPIMFDDEDGDFVLDVSDRCPGTPFGVAVDTLGCPLDEDKDGVPDYLDQELATAERAWVDEQGVTITRSEFAEALAVREDVMERENLEEYLSTIRGEYRLDSALDIPENFISIDIDGDGYLSFDELILVIDRYFDSQIDMNVDDLRDLYEFFFAQ